MNGVKLTSIEIRFIDGRLDGPVIAYTIVPTQPTGQTTTTCSVRMDDIERLKAAATAIQQQVRAS